MAANGASVVDDRAGIMFGVELYVPWDSAGGVPLRNVPDVIGLVGHREGAAESRVLQGRDARSVRVLVPDCRGLDQNFHNVTIVDMGDVPESHISHPELSTLIQQWPPAVINHMGWRQRELEEMRAAGKTRYRQSRPTCCMCQPGPGSFLLNVSSCSVGGICLVCGGRVVEDKRRTPAVSRLPVVDGGVPLSAQADVDVELCQVFQDVGARPVMVTPVRDPEGGGGP